jgi:nucleoside-diphosphate-sugar epimerase
VEYCQRDLTILNPIEFTTFSPDIIFHLAATFERTEEDPEFWEDNFENNIVLSHKVTDAAKKCKNLKKFIFASSYLNYSPGLYLKNRPQDNFVKLKETDLVNTRNLCGAAKYYTEKELDFISKMYGHFIGISARIFRVYGHGSRDIISRWLRMALNGEELIVFQKENMFDYIFAEDVAEGLMKMAENINKNEIINLGTGTARKIEEVIKILREQIPRTKIKEIKKEELYEASCADISKLTSLTEWQPKISLEEGIKKIIKYEKRNLEEE